MLEELLSEWPVRAVVASTRGEVDDVAAMLRGRVDYLLEFTSQTPCPSATHTLRPRRWGATDWPQPSARQCSIRVRTC